MALLRGQIDKTKELRPERDLNPRPLAFEACSRPLCSNRCLNLHLVKTWKHSGQNFTKREQNQQIRLSLLSPHFSLFSETTMAAFVPLPVINWLAFLTIVALFWPEYLFLSFLDLSISSGGTSKILPLSNKVRPVWKTIYCWTLASQRQLIFYPTNWKCFFFKASLKEDSNQNKKLL